MTTNPNFVLPKLYLIGYTKIHRDEIFRYLNDTDQNEFVDDLVEALENGIDEGEILCSFYAKACYASLTTKKNENISKVRSIENNILSTINSEHGSVFEHCWLNFMITDCSRVYTHELVRHRVGTAFSQTSGRYVRSEILKIVHDPILNPIEDLCEDIRQKIQNFYNEAVNRMGLNGEGVNFNKKKKITSALRRYLPNGQANEIGLSLNLRALRFTIQKRTSRDAEWEIRVIFNLIAESVKEKYKLIFADAKYEMVDGINEITFDNKNI